MPLVPEPINCDISVKQAIQALSKKLEHANYFNFGASKLVATDTNQKFVSVSDLSSWIAGTTNQVIVTDNGDGTVTLSAPQNIHTDAVPEFAGITIKDSGDNIIFYVDDDELYFTAIPAEGLTGQPMGIFPLIITYSS